MARYILPFVTLALCSAVCAQTPSRVLTQYGEVEGTQTNLSGHTISRYLGIPFAKPPIGSLRFMLPKEPQPWSATLTVKAYQKICMQGTDPDADEDCLYLNVFAPEGSNLPVMIWIHGGALHAGSATFFNPETLSITGKVIVVTINYRLNVFGFFSSGDDVAEGNVGLQDQLMALKWVKNNIAGFGGDADKITIFGESAGAFSVASHVLSPLSQEYFNRGICQSGSIIGSCIESIAERGQRSIRLAQYFDCPTEDSADMVSCLQKVDAQSVLSALTNPNVLYFDNAGLLLTYGNSFFPEHPDDLIKGGHIKDMELMMGLNSDEGLLYFMSGVIRVPGAKRQTVDDYLTHGVEHDDPLLYDGLAFAINELGIPTNVPQADIETILMDFFFENLRDPVGNMRGMLDYIGQVLFYGQTMRTLDQFSASGIKLHLYYLDQVLNLTNSDDYISGPRSLSTLNPDLPLGVPHAADIDYVFGFVSETVDPDNSIHYQVSEVEREVGRSMVHAWTQFAKTGVPTFLSGDGAVISWPEYDNLNQNYLEFKYPMSESSRKSRFLPSSTSFHTKLLPVYMASFTAAECPVTGRGSKIVGASTHVLWLSLFALQFLGQADITTVKLF